MRQSKHVKMDKNKQQTICNPAKTSKACLCTRKYLVTIETRITQIVNSTSKIKAVFSVIFKDYGITKLDTN